LHLDAALSRLGLGARLSGVMLSIGKLRAGQEGYYLASVGHGVEDYYTEAGEVPGRWVGVGADELGLAGEVDDDDFRAVLSGVDPFSGKSLRRSNARVPGFDLTLSAPKSVSLVWALGAGLIATGASAPAGFVVAAIGLAVAWARIYLGLHYPIDMAASAAVAAFGAVIACALRQFVERTLLPIIEGIYERALRILGLSAALFPRRDGLHRDRRQGQ